MSRKRRKGPANEKQRLLREAKEGKSPVRCLIIRNLAVGKNRDLKTGWTTASISLFPHKVDIGGKKEE